MTVLANWEWVVLSIYAMLIGAILVVGEIIYRKNNGISHITRKLVHIVVGVVSAVMPFIFQHKEGLLFISIVFIIINFLLLTFKVLPSLNSNQFTIGTVLFPVSFLLLILIFWDLNKVLVSYGMLIMALSDGFASVVGLRWKNPHLYQPLGGSKSIEGSMVVAIFTALITLFFLTLEPISGIRIVPFYQGLAIGLSMGLSAILLENLSIAGTDNLTLPLGSAFIFYGILYGYIQINVFFPILLFSFLLGIFAYARKWLEPGGVLLMIVMAACISGPGHPQMLIPMLIFFISGSFLSNIFSGMKKKQENGRTISQVAANGVIPVCFILLYYFYHSHSFLIAYLASIATATADTWATEIGKLSRVKPIRVTHWVKCESGLSGGITIYGMVASVLGSFAVASVLFLPLFHWSLIDFFIVLAAGFVGALVDSVIGDIFQTKYQCQKCGCLTDKKNHCSLPTSFHSGSKWVTNNGVNFISIAIMGIIVWLIV